MQRHICKERAHGENKANKGWSTWILSFAILNASKLEPNANGMLLSTAMAIAMDMYSRNVQAHGTVAQDSRSS